MGVKPVLLRSHSFAAERIRKDTWGFMQSEMPDQRNAASQKDGSREYYTDQRNADEKDQHAATGEKSPRNASTHNDLGHVDL